MKKRVQNFNPRAPCGARPRTGVRAQIQHLFQPTRPLRGATAAVAKFNNSPIFQPTRPLRGATIRSTTAPKTMRISTHAPLAGRDLPDSCGSARHPHFNPRAPCGARRSSTPRVRSDAADISTHAPLAGRDGISPQSLYRYMKFQPTRPLRGATEILGLTGTANLFQPTRPLRGATEAAGGDM